MKNILTIVLLFVGTCVSHAQIIQAVRWSYAAKKLNDKEAILYLKADVKPGWHIFSINMKDGGPTKTSFKFTPTKEYTLNGKPIEPISIKKFEPVFNMDVFYFEKSVIFQQKITLNTPNLIVKGSVEFMTCNATSCLPAQVITFSIPVN